ncbi:ATP-binding protein [candidate division KSB1 bacterium]|nr:ATP-binding protein [candidate division KSB1 bacterium]
MVRKLPKSEINYQLKVPSQTDNLELIREFVSRVAAKMGFDSDEVNKIELAIDEACTNVIKHAYEKNSKKPIDIAIKLDYDKLTIFVTDQGKGFNVDDIKTPDMKEYLAEMRVGGLGIFLMKNLMDEVKFEIKPGVRNQVKMVKYYMKDNKKVKEEHDDVTR